MTTQKISIRFFDDREVRALWDEENAKWWFSVLDIVAVLTDQNDYAKTRNYWKYLKAKLKNDGSEVVSATTQLRIFASNVEQRFSVKFDYKRISNPSRGFPAESASHLLLNCVYKFNSKYLQIEDRST